MHDASGEGVRPQRATAEARLPGRSAVASVLLATCLAVGLATTADASHRDRGNAHRDRGGVVYAMTNASEGNAILAYLRDGRGRLHPVGRAVSTGGAGGSVTAGVDPLGSQGSLVYDAGHDLLFAVNAGDDTVAVLAPRRSGLRLRLRDVAPSGGHIPVSLAVSGDRLYVLNAGGTGSLATFEIDHHGRLTALDALDLGLPARATTPPFDQVMAPGQVGVDALARTLILTHAGGQELLTVALDDAGLPQGPLVSTPSPGLVPFAFDVTRHGSPLVAEAASGSVSAFDPPVPGKPLSVTAAAVATGQAATCWIVVHDGGFAYVSNTGSDTLSVYGYTRTGQLELLDDVAASTETGGAPTDMTLAGDGSYLYTLDAGSGTISGFAIDRDTGALDRIETEGGLPAGAGIQGIAARDF